MLEAIAFRINNEIEFIIFTIMAITLLGYVFFFITKNENTINKHIKLYGLLINLRNIDVLVLSIGILKLLVTIYCACNISKDIFGFIAIIIMLEILFILYNYRRVIFEVISNVGIIVILYFINILQTYELEVETNKYVMLIRITLIVFTVLYAIYIFIANLDDIVKKNKNRKERVR